VATSANTGPRYWLWVTRPEYYENSPCLLGEGDTDGWWTCHKDTRRGDLVFLWRTTPRRDIGHVIQARSDAYCIAEDAYASERGWDYACDYQVLYRFEEPITIEDLHKDPYLQEWSAYRAQFRRRVFRIAVEHWRRLSKIASEKNPGYREFIEGAQCDSLAESIVLEEQLEEALVRNLGLLKRFGYNLDLYVDPAAEVVGRQLVCRGNGGRIDLLCRDRKRKRYVVIELKNVRAGQNAFAQICNYMGWVQERIAGNAPVIGLVISRGYDAKFESALRVTDRVFHLDVTQLGFQ
jgi:hypothetical protein